jgi:hypothetical protein
MRNDPPRGRGSPPPRRRGTPQTKQSQWTRSESSRSHSAQRSYEHYIALARAAALNGNMIEAENYYQYAEHYYRSMATDSREV